MNTCMGLLVALLLAPPAAGASLDYDRDGYVYSRQRSFRIPLDLTPTERQKAVSIRLFVSEDGGQTWVRHGDGPADMQSVAFKAKSDGEFWFNVALVDSRGRQAPEEIRSGRPGLKVIVDSAPPALSVKPMKTKNDRRGIRWEMDDAHLDPASLRFAVSHSKALDQWEPLDVRHPERLQSWFEDGAEVFGVQAMVKDRAGNVSVTQINIVGDRFNRAPVDRFALLEKDSAKTVAIPRAQSSDEGLAVRPAPKQPVTHTAASPRRQSADIREAPIAVATEAPAVKSKEIIPTASESTEPADTGHNISNTNRVVVNYELDAKANPADTRVEIWGSADRGKTWKPMGLDSDCQSPAEIDLPGEGAWGLHIAVVGAKTPAVAPKPGMEPDTYVEVDSTAPAIEVAVMDIRQGKAYLQWRAEDKNLRPDSVVLQASPSQSGPWTTVGKGLKGAGDFVWEYGTQTGPTYFRAEARDLAGNMGFAVTDTTVDLESTTPKAKAKAVNVRAKPRNAEAAE